MRTRIAFSMLAVLTLSFGSGVAHAGSLVGYWSFDNIQGTVVPDLSGSGNDGTINGAPLTVDGPFGKALQLDGINDYIDCGNAESLNLTEKVTLAAWVKTVDAGEPAAGQTGGQNHYISKHNSYQMKHRTNLLIFAIWDSGSPHATRISIDDSFNGEWHHVVGMYDGTVLKTYVDGKLEGEAGHVGDIDPIALNVNIGKNPNQDNMNFDGQIDEALIYNRDLSTAQVYELFQGTLPSFNRATLPQPVDGDKGVAMPLLRWTAGEGAIAHEVYLGSSADLTEADFQGRQLVTMYYHAAPLTPGETYYWRVDEVAADGTIAKGNVWSFTSASLKAYEPKPRDGAKWVDSEAVQLDWEFGTDSLTHDVYFGTDKAAVETGDASVFKANLPANTFSPGTLEDNTTYYWRIDEHSRTGELHQGSVWTFTTAGGPYDGVKAEYFANPDLVGDPTVIRSEPLIDLAWPEGTTEGVNSPAVGIPTNDYSARWSAELHVAFSGEYRLVINVNNSGKLWLDDKLLIDRWPNDGGIPEYTTTSIQLETGRVYSLVMEWNKYNANSLARLEWIDPFGERTVVPPGALQLPMRANRPQPSAEQKDVTDRPILLWHAGDKAAHHDVYFGNDAEAMASADASSDLYQGRQSLDETTFDPGVLDWGTTYYWRIDEVNEAAPDGPWAGHVWSFTTADFLVVDDFDSYTDDEGNRIYETWIDGWTNNTGSVVGNLQAPFAEQRIVHTGRQSMPLDYDNVNTPYYSEAERTWEAPQDWTINGVDTLTIYLRGNAANGEDTVYVAVEDSAGKIATVANTDPTVVTTTRWAEWKIPLSNFTGVNPARVKMLYIGVGNRAAPTAGGAGRLHIDSIRVTKSAP